MNTHSRPLDSAAEDQAALWAARLEGEPLTPARQTELGYWLEQHPLHRDLLSRYCQFSAELEQSLPVLAAEGTLLMPEASTTPAATSRRAWLRRRNVFAAVTLAAAAAVAIMVWPAETRLLEPLRLATTVAQRQTITLPDGTTVELNAHTSLAVESSASERRVRLASGQAFFTVAHDTAHPFIVETPAGAVRVTGTAFDVRAEAAHELEVTVLQGSVQVSVGGNEHSPALSPVALEPGDRLSASSSHDVQRSHLSTADLDHALAWRQGMAVFTGTPLRDALARFARYHGRGITATTEAGDVRVAGRYSLDDLDGFLSSIEAVHPVQVQSDLSGTITVAFRPTR